MGGATESAVSVRGLTVRYGDHTAVDDLDLEVRSGEIFGFLGPNGAGKTTTIRALLDLLRPDEGEVRVLGRDVRAAGGELRARMGYLPGDLAVFPFLTARETMALHADLNRAGAPSRDDVLARLGFPDRALDRPMRTCSTGMRQMIGITCALQHDPDLLVLDEPTTGLDPIVRRQFLALLRDRAAAGATILFSSHVLAEVEDCADRVALVSGGKIRMLAGIDELRVRSPRRVELWFADGRRETRAHRGDPAELLDSIEREGLVDVTIRPVDLGELFREIVEEGRET